MCFEVGSSPFYERLVVRSSGLGFMFHMFGIKCRLIFTGTPLELLFYFTIVSIFYLNPFSNVFHCACLFYTYVGFFSQSNLRQSATLKGSSAENKNISHHPSLFVSPVSSWWPSRV